MSEKRSLAVFIVNEKDSGLIFALSIVCEAKE
jgi:hypothetical protein